MYDDDGKPTYSDKFHYHAYFEGYNHVQGFTKYAEVF